MAATMTSRTSWSVFTAKASIALGRLPHGRECGVQFIRSPEFNPLQRDAFRLCRGTQGVKCRTRGSSGL